MRHANVEHDSACARGIARSQELARSRMSTDVPAHRLEQEHEGTAKRGVIIDHVNAGVS